MVIITEVDNEQTFRVSQESQEVVDQNESRRSVEDVGTVLVGFPSCLFVCFPRKMVVPYP